MSNWNPLYPFDDDVSPLEDAIREAEWEDDMRMFERRRRRKKELTDKDEDEDEENFFRILKG